MTTTAIKRFENEHMTQNADKQWKLLYPRVEETDVFWKGPESKYLGLAGQSVYSSASQHEGNHRQPANGRAWGVPGKNRFIKTGRRVNLASGLH